MAKGKKTGGKPFQKGNKLGGRAGLPKEIRDISRQTKPQIINAYWKIANISYDSLPDKNKLTKEQFNAKMKTLMKGMSLVEVGVFKCVVDFMSTGNINNISRIWAECHGTPKQSLDINAGFTLADMIGSMSDEDLNETLKKFIKG